MRLYAALLVRNEAGFDRHLRKVLACCQTWADGILVLDDGSTDDTVEVATAFGAEVRVREASVPRAWGNEAPARAELFAWTQEVCGRRDWVVWTDADMVLAGDPRPLMQSYECNAWAWPLYDLWSETEYRADQFWRGHEYPRVWMVQPNNVPHGWVPQWGRDGLHVGHLPDNLPMRVGVAPPDLYWKHLAYSTEQARQKKHAQYMAKSHLLTPFELAHAQSILTPP